ncbi:GSCFA domain-containing protein [Hymenobacter sp. BT664]|uniref:GSCFA domain-containing protein n=1 Tax=Hymenobacter montanus TaxID=2771359 RepID=A0A927BCC2_9BACT|nr:GSCFA domain-containing protein [Hymenobacter montanus]MBD2768185.1 GSCFA domain-containing protein [Hymenobacter montanus]
MFRTELPIAPATNQLPRTARVLTMGSCFADSIGSRLAANKVDTLVNPFGTVFQPLALTRLLRAAAGEEVDWQQHLVQARGRWQSYDLHGSLGAESPVELLQTIQELVRQTGEFLRNAEVVLLTLGTAWAYRLRETGELVNNCHKQSADLFVRELLTPDEIINDLAETHAYLRRFNPRLRLVLTVSPVRHLKDTLPLNAVSKSVLRVATHIVSDLLPDVAYFPAYELLLDDLRDYRFYAADMLHPSEVAEDYIWDKFARTYFDADFGRFRKEWAAVRQSLGHRPLHPGAPEHRQFLANTLQKLEQLSLRKVEVAAELKEVRAKIAALPAPRQPEPEEVPEDDEERIDIGQNSPATKPEEMALPTAELPSLAGSRSPRLSPEEFRTQRHARGGRPERGRRDGRGPGQPQTPGENEQFQKAAFAGEQSADINPPTLPTQPLADGSSIEQPVAPTAFAEAANLGADATGSEQPAKKKKRRSRGGAKRTARKNALRLATGEVASADTVLPENAAALPPSMPEAGAADEPLREQFGEVPSPISGISAPEKLSGQRGKPRRPPQVALYAPAPEAPVAAETLTPTEAVARPSETASSPIEAEASSSDTSRIEPNPTTSRRNRNRGKRAEVLAQAVEAPTAISASAPGPTVAPISDNGEQLTTPTPPKPVRAEGSRRNQVRQPPPAPVGPTPVATDPAPAANEPAAPETTPPPPARHSNRAKRVVTGARTEKPAVDIPVVPVPDALSGRTQVAAGRMKGTSASLIEASAEPAVQTGKAAPKQSAKAVASKKDASQAAAPPRAAKAKSTKSKPDLAPTTPEAGPSAAETAAAVTKRKPAAKAKPGAKSGADKPKPPKKPTKPA